MEIELLKTSLSYFVDNTKVVRDKDKEIAEIIVDYVDNKPVKLLGFGTSSNKSDFEIKEEGFEYFKRLNEEICQKR